MVSKFRSHFHGLRRIQTIVERSVVHIIDRPSPDASERDARDLLQPVASYLEAFGGVDFEDQLLTDDLYSTRLALRRLRYAVLPIRRRSSHSIHGDRPFETRFHGAIQRSRKPDQFHESEPILSNAHSIITENMNKKINNITALAAEDFQVFIQFSDT